MTRDGPACGTDPLRGCGNNEHVLLVANFAIRAGLLVLAGAVAFTAGWPGGVGLAAQITALSVAAAC